MPIKSRIVRSGVAEDFAPGAVVLVTLNHPREKYWGTVIAVTPAGISLRGVDLNSFEDFARQIKAGEDVAPNAVFFPMHRVERMDGFPKWRDPVDAGALLQQDGTKLFRLH